jgi:hypothetical protein
MLVRDLLQFPYNVDARRCVGQESAYNYFFVGFA